MIWYLVAFQATTYTLTASASVSVSEDFYGDDPDNNIRQVQYTLC